MSILNGKGTSTGAPSAKRTRSLTVLDIGSSKVCCIIARLRPREESAHLPGRTHRIEVLGIGHQKSRGIKSGVIVNLDAAEQAIRLAVDAAERMAGLTVELDDRQHFVGPFEERELFRKYQPWWP